MYGQSLEPKLELYGILVQKAQYNEFCRVWDKELGLGELCNGLHEFKKQSDKNKNYYNQRTFRLRRL